MTDEKSNHESFGSAGRTLRISKPEKWPVEALLIAGFVTQVGEADGQEVYAWTERALRLADEFWRDYMAHRGIEKDGPE